MSVFCNAAIAYREREIARIGNMSHRSDPSGEWTSDDSREYQRDVLAMLRREVRALQALPLDVTEADVLRACGFSEREIARRTECAA